jgi:hypothetical protein
MFGLDKSRRRIDRKHQSALTSTSKSIPTFVRTEEAKKQLSDTLFINIYNIYASKMVVV